MFDFADLLMSLFCMKRDLSYPRSNVILMLIFSLVLEVGYRVLCNFMICLLLFVLRTDMFSAHTHKLLLQSESFPIVL